MKTQQVIFFESYAAINGLSKLGLGEAALHRSSNKKSAKSHKKDVALQAIKDRELIDNREKLRIEFNEKLLKGELREPTRKESIIARANGHEDLESTKAARRICHKNGWDWYVNPFTEL